MEPENMTPEEARKVMDQQYAVVLTGREWTAVSGALHFLGVNQYAIEVHHMQILPPESFDLASRIARQVVGDIDVIEGYKPTED